MARGCNLFWQAVALMDIAPAQIARAHADEALAEECQRRARAAQDALQHPKLDQPGREYLEGLIARFNGLAERLRKTLSQQPEPVLNPENQPRSQKW